MSQTPREALAIALANDELEDWNPKAFADKRADIVMAGLAGAGFVVTPNGWQPIETALKDGTEFLATDGNLLGIGRHHREVEPETVLNTEKWQAYYHKVHEPFEVRFTSNGLFPEGFDYLENCRRSEEAWEAAKVHAPDFERVPNPKAGEVREWDFASAFHAFDGEAPTQDYDGPVGFKPTHWMPLPPPPENEGI